MLRVKSSQKNSLNIPVDILIIGGGFQGLVLLNLFKENNYSTALVTNTPLGFGQSLHGHGLFESGYLKPKPELRKSVIQDWLPFLKKSGVKVYGDWYVLTSDESFTTLQDLWLSGGYPFKVVLPTDLPYEFRKGDIFSKNTVNKVVSIKDYCFSKSQLVRTLAKGNEDQIMIGDILDFTLSATGNKLKINTVTVASRNKGQTINLSPKMLVIASGGGTPQLINLLADKVDSVSKKSSQVRAINSHITFNKLHMITLRGSSKDLPNVSAFIPPKKLKIVSHLEGGIVTWYVTNEPLPPIDSSKVDYSGKAEFDKAQIADGLTNLFSMLPNVKQRAIDGKIQFFIFAGAKQGIDGQLNIQYCELINGVANLIVALPSFAGGVWICAKRALKLVQSKMKPGGNLVRISLNDLLAFGIHTEDENIKWLNWQDLLDLYPDINS